MGYKIYKKVKVLSVERQEQTHMLRPRDIADPLRERDNYWVTIARFSDVDYEATISDFKKEVVAGEVVSIAINDKNQVIAVINHTTGKEGSLKKNPGEFQEIGSILFYISIPSLLSFFIARKAFQTEKYHQLGWIIIAVGIIIVLFILKGIMQEFRESDLALRKLRE